MTILILNAFLYLLWLVRTYRREKEVTIYSFLIGLITVVSLCGVYIVGMDYYKYEDPNKIRNIVPYVLSFIGFFLLFFPFKNYNRNFRLYQPEFLSPAFNYFLYIWVFVCGALLIIRIRQAAMGVAFGLDQAYDMRHNDGLQLPWMMPMNEFEAKIIWIGSILLNVTSPLMMFYSVFCLKRGEKYLPLLVLIISVLPFILDGLASGSRGYMVWSFFRLVFIFLLLKEKLPSVMVKKIFGVISISMGIVLVFTIMTSVLRLENTGDTTPLAGILHYFGEPFPNVDCLYWNNVFNHPMGDRLFPDFTNFAGHVGNSSDEYFKYWTAITGVHCENWKIYFIDLYIEFDIAGALLFIAAVSLLFTIFFKKYLISVYTIPVYYFYFELCSSSFTGYNQFSSQIISSLTMLFWQDIMLFVFCRGKKNTLNNNKL